MSILAQDTFVRSNVSGSWGTSSDGESWSFTGHAATESLTSNEGVIASNGSNDTSAQLGTNTSANCDVLCRIAIGAGLDVAGVQGRFSPGGGSPTCYKLLWYAGTTNAIHLNKAVSGVNTQLTSVAFTMTVGTFYWFRLHISGSTLYGKVWQDGTSEPSNWMTTVTDTSVTGSGGFALLASTSSGPGVQFDHFTATDGAAGVHDIGARFPVAFAQDTFNRANTAASTTISTGWGNPSDNPVNGDTWSQTGASTMSWQINGNEGTATGTTNVTYAQLGTGRIANGEIVTRFSLSGSGDAAGVFLRYADASNLYRVRISNTQWSLQKVIAGAVTTLATVTATQTVGTFYFVRMRVAGNQLLGKVWQSGTAEPGWQASITDGALSASGHYGLVINLGASGDSASFDSLVVLDAPTSYHDIASRVRIAAPGTSRDLGTRLILYGRRLRDIGSRLKLQAIPLRDIATRLVLLPPGATKVARDIASRSNTAISQDTFARSQTAGNPLISDVTGWGTPSGNPPTGDTWSSQGTAIFFWTISAAKQGVATTTSTLGTSYALLGNTQLANVEALIQFTTSEVGDTAGVTLRYVNTNNHYRFYYTNGLFSIVRFLGGMAVTLTSSPVLYSPGTMYNLRARAVGTNLLLRVWPADGSVEPTNWTVTASDAAFSTGGYGLVITTTTVGDTVTFDDIAFYDGNAVYSPLRDLFSRVRLQANTSRDLATRFVLGIANTPHDLATRARIAAMQLRDIGSRYRLQAIPLRDIATRFTVHVSQAAVHPRDLACRFILGGPPVQFTPTPPVLPAVISEVLPLARPPRKPYTVNGTVLDTQPTVMTAPVGTFNQLAAGTTFVLIFTNPSTNTQSLLANGSTASMQFGLADGNVTTGQVSLTSTLTGTTLVVSVTLTQSITISQWVVTTQFL